MNRANDCIFRIMEGKNSIQVINLKNGEYENSLPGIYGFRKKMILAGDSVLYCIPLLLKDAAYEIYALTSSGQFLGGIKKRLVGRSVRRIILIWG